MAYDMKKNSATITNGRDRAGARAMYKAVGFSDEDLRKPIVGIANTWTETMPCNFNLRGSPSTCGRHPRRRRNADGVQHDRDQRRHHDGHRGHEGLARVAAK
jgi:dihydroxyacid dehydratase/phosphogluconate dehydratase